MHTTVSSIVASIALLVMAHPCSAQLVSVQCCSIEADFEGITECVGGTNVLVRPALCAPAATCVLGFGDDMTFMDGLCAPPQEIPVFTRGFCGSWIDESTPVVHQCVAIPNVGVTMFEVFDDEQDGDLDIVDLSMFKQVYDGVPKLVQSEADMASLECCIPGALISQIAECLSGPGVTTQPGTCTIKPTCLAGFTAPLEPGDWLYKVCDPSPGQLDPYSSHCVSWQSSGQPVVFECQTNPTAAPSFFVLADTDADIDVDLRDFAVFQRDIANSE